MTACGTVVRAKVAPMEWAIMGVASVLMIGLTWFQVWSLGMTDVLGFVTGGICVWLVVREHVANWPIGLANNLVFFILFFQARLFSDMALQVVYFGLGVYGWWNWLRGGPGHRELAISLTRRGEWIAMALVILGGTWAQEQVLTYFKDAAPFGDGLTTALSLAAQFLLCRKKLENWFFWIAADIIYVPLYLSRNLPLTATLYGIFLVMCLFGLSQWRNKWKRLQAA